MTHLRGPNDGPALVAALTASTGLYAGIAHGVVKGAEKEKLVAMLSIQTFSTIIIPVLRELYQSKSPKIAQMVWYYLARILSVYIVGAAVFIHRFPECVAPGWFCRCGQSHNLMHLLVVLGSSLTSKGIADWCDEVSYLK
jgi:predicted membrane channel-forming protein YqfA (hemolysin III family)